MKRTLGLLALIALPLAAGADTMLPLTCQGCMVGQTSAPKAARIFTYPAADTLVFQSGTLIRFADAQQVLVCTADIPAPSNTDACPDASKVSVPKEQVRVSASGTPAPAPTSAETPNHISLEWPAVTQYLPGSTHDGGMPDVLSLPAGTVTYTVRETLDDGAETILGTTEATTYDVSNVPFGHKACFTVTAKFTEAEKTLYEYRESAPSAPFCPSLISRPSPTVVTVVSPTGVSATVTVEARAQ